MPYVRLLGAQVAIGAAAIFARYALLGAGALAVSALRLAIAAGVVFALTRRLVPLTRARERSFAVAGLVLAIHFATWIASLAYTSVAVATLLVTTSPLWTEAYDVVRERRAPTRAFALAIALGFAGVALVALGRTTSPPPVPGHELLGDALALTGSLAIGAYLLLVRAAAVDHRGARLGTRQIVARTYGWATLALAAFALAGHQGPPPLAATTAWLGILAMALISQVLGHTALNAALADFTPSVVALATLCEPVVAALLAAALFEERIGAATIGGGVLVLGAVAITLLGTRALGNRVAET